MAVWCRTEKLEGLKARDKDNLAYGGKWAMHVVWVGNPPQQLNALVSTSGTKLQLPITPACYGDGSFNATIVLPHRRPPGGIVSSLRDTEQSPHDAADFYTPQGSHTWQPSLECSQGSDILSYVLWYEHEFLNGVYRTLWHLRAPLERLSRSYNAPDAADRNRVASIGLRALATTWHGRPDYWWALMIQSRASLFQSLPYLDIPTRYSQFGPYDREAGLAYVYTAGRWYGSSPATLSIGAVGQWGVDIPQMTRPLPDDGVLALDLVTLELSHRDSSGAGNITIPLLADPVGAVLDSDSPFLELPRSVCFDIADELDLHYIEESGLFVMDTSVIAHLSMLQPSLRFGLGGAGRREIYEDQMPAAQSGARLVIQLPFEALNHTLTYAGHEQLYFPIRIAEENRGIVLGRAIFQEMWLTVDYNSHEFTIAPALGQSIEKLNWDLGSIYEPPWWERALDFAALVGPWALLSGLILAGLLVLPLTKIALNVWKCRQRRRRLDRAWVESHSRSLPSEVLQQYASAARREEERRPARLQAPALLASSSRTTGQSHSRGLEAVWSRVFRTMTAVEGTVRLSEFDGMEEEEVATRRRIARQRRRHAIERQQKRLYEAWTGGKRVGYWFSQHLVTPALRHTIVEPVKWTVKFAAVAWERQRLGQIRRR